MLLATLSTRRVSWRWPSIGCKIPTRQAARACDRRKRPDDRACLWAQACDSWVMGKYDPLRRFLARQRGDRVEMSFHEIECRIGALLPKAAARAAWWSGEHEPAVSVQGQSWREAGYRARLGPNERVTFERLAPRRG